VFDGHGQLVADGLDDEPPPVLTQHRVPDAGVEVFRGELPAVCERRSSSRSANSEAYSEPPTQMI
jgi:hypothetical protein